MKMETFENLSTNVGVKEGGSRGRDLRFSGQSDEGSQLNRCRNVQEVGGLV